MRVSLSRAEVTEIEEISGTTTRRYSGRGMYGEQCLAVEGSLGDLMRFTIAAVTVLGEDTVEDVAARACMDSMGLDRVFYFPGVGVTEEGGEPDYEEHGRTSGGLAWSVTAYGLRVVARLGGHTDDETYATAEEAEEAAVRYSTDYGDR